MVENFKILKILKSQQLKIIINLCKYGLVALNKSVDILLFIYK
jgi:hypothetical protein